MTDDPQLDEAPKPALWGLLHLTADATVTRPDGTTDEED